MFLGIEIGGTKLQLGIGPGDGTVRALWRGEVNIADGPEGIRRQIVAGIPEVLRRSGIDAPALRSVGVGFGGPVDDATRSVIKSHQIDEWDNFPLAEWMGKLVGLPCALGNDADVAGLAEALFGAAKGLSPVFYITIGSGIGGGLILGGAIYRGCGRGAAEIGHLTILRDEISGFKRHPVELEASGWAMEERARAEAMHPGARAATLLRLAGGDRQKITSKHVAEAAALGDSLAIEILGHARHVLADAISQVITLLCPRRIVIGGGVSLMGADLLFGPLRQLVAERVFAPFAGCYDIVPAQLGEEVVVHGALALARQMVIPT
jgi:glucokinase